MAMDLVFLGTGSAYPSPTRGASCIALRLSIEDGFWIFDCGEGAQVQLMKSQVKAGKVNKIFISHLHGDHMFGLPGLLCTISQNNQRTEPVEIYGPEGLRKYIRTSLELSRSLLGFKYMVHELKVLPCQIPPELQRWKVDSTCPSGGYLHPDEIDGRLIEPGSDDIWTLIEHEKYTVKAMWLKHRIPSFGFSLEEKSSPGKLDPSKLIAEGLQSGPIFGKIKRGETVIAPSGKEIKPEDVIGPPRPGRKIVVLGDTSDSSEVSKVGMNADVLVHEATLEGTMWEKALANGHSTSVMAAQVAKDLNVGKLVLTHFSQRYKPLSMIESPDDEETVGIMMVEASTIFDEEKIVLAEDFLTVSIPLKS